MTAPEFLTFIALGDVTAFSVALGLMLLIGLVEGLGLLLGFAFSGLLDNLLPDVDLDVDAPELDHGAVGEFLTWLRVREVPVIVILIAFLTSFGTIGYALQFLSLATFGGTTSWILAVPISVILSLPGLRLFISLLAKIMPKDETSARSRKSFVGQMATITLGYAEKGHSAQARFTDGHGQTHYVMLQPDLTGERFEQGETVLIVRKKGTEFRAIRSDNTHLNDA